MRTFALSTVALLFLASQGMADPAAGTKTDTKDRTDRKEDRGTDHKEGKAKWDQQHRDHLNAALAGMVLLGNNEEVALGEFAQQKAQNEKVKQFAKMMVEHHGKYGEQLAKYAPERANEKLHAGWSNDTHNKTAGDIKSESKATERAEANNDQPTADRERYARGFNAGDTRQGGPMLEINREAVEACLALTTEDMGRHQGAEFDKCYIGQQIGAHVGMLAKLKTFERHTQGDLQKVFRDGAAETQKHLDQARAIMKELESKNRVAQAN